MVAIDLHSFFVHIMIIDCLVTNIIRDIIFCVQHKKINHTGLEQLKGIPGD